MHNHLNEAFLINPHRIDYFSFQKNHQKSCSACSNKIEGKYYTVSGDIICDKCYKVDVFYFVKRDHYLKDLSSMIHSI